MRKSIFLTILSMLILEPLIAQEIIFKASAPDSVSMGEIFNVIYVINENTDSIRVSSFENFEFVAGPETSLSTNVSIINSITKKSIQKTFTYELRPMVKGIFVIPEASIIVGGRKYYSNPLTIKVKNVSKRQQSDNVEEITKDELYLELSFSKHEVYVQEAITATLKLHSSLQVNQINRTQLPAFDDFLFYDLSETIIQPKIEMVKGKKMMTVLVNKILLYPQRSGSLQLSGGELKCIAKGALNKEKSKSVMDDLFEHSDKSKEYTLKIDAQTITVKPLPEKIPADFIHICGTNIKIAATVNKATVKANTPFVYEITLSGIGNLKLTPTPKLNIPAEFKEVTNSANNNLEYKRDGIIGYRTFSYTIVPKQEGDFKIPIHSMSYFNLDTKQYQTITTQPVWVKVEKSQDTSLVLKDNTLLPKEANERTDGCDVVVAMDVSGTMLAQDIKPNRLEASVNATGKFLLKQKGKVGLVIFSEGGRVKCPLTSNLKVLGDSLNTISDLDLGNGTAIGIGLGNAMLELRKSKAKSKIIVLLTDGVNNIGCITPKMAAKLARCFGINIYAIGVASKDSLATYPYKTPSGVEMIKLPVDIDDKILREIANNTGGRYFRATESNSFDYIYQEIAKSITIKKQNNQYHGDMSKDDAERILNVITQDNEELNQKLKNRKKQ